MTEPGPAGRAELRCAAAFSAHPDPAVAVGEVVGGVLDRLDPHPDVAVVAMSGPQSAQLDRVVGAVRSLLAPDAVIGSTARAVFGGPQDLAGGGGLVLWACHGAGLRPITMVTDGIDPEPVASDVSPGDVVFLLAGPGFSIDVLAEARRVRTPPGDGVLDGLTTFVGLVAPARTAGVSSRLIGGGSVVDRGAVGLALPGSTARLYDLEVPDRDVLDDPAGPDDGSAAIIAGGAGALVMVDRSVELSARWELEIDRSLQHLNGAVAGIVGAGFTLGPGTATGRGGLQGTSVLVVG